MSSSTHSRDHVLTNAFCTAVRGDKSDEGGKAVVDSMYAVTPDFREQTGVARAWLALIPDLPGKEFPKTRGSLWNIVILEWTKLGVGEGDALYIKPLIALEDRTKKELDAFREILRAVLEFVPPSDAVSLISQLIRRHWGQMSPEAVKIFGSSMAHFATPRDLYKMANALVSDRE